MAITVWGERATWIIVATISFLLLAPFGAVVIDRRLRALAKAVATALDGPLHDRIHRIPIKAQQFAGIADRAARLQHFQGKRFKHQRETRMLVGPREADRLHAALCAVGARHASREARLKLHRVEVPPRALGGEVVSRTNHATFRAAEAFTDMLQREFHALLRQDETHVCDLPVTVQAE